MCDTNKDVAKYPETAPNATVNYMNVSHNVLFSPPWISIQTGKNITKNTYIWIKIEILKKIQLEILI